MERIDIDNFEEYAIDYIDGTLSPAGVIAFESFLNLHPHLIRDLELAERGFLPNSPPESFPDKSRLHKKKRRPSAIFLLKNRWAIGIAASLLFAAFIYTWVINEGSHALESQDLIASNEIIEHAEFTSKHETVSLSTDQSPTSNTEQNQIVHSANQNEISTKSANNLKHASPADIYTASEATPSPLVKKTEPVRTRQVLLPAQSESVMAINIIEESTENEQNAFSRETVRPVSTTMALNLDEPDLFVTKTAALNTQQTQSRKSGGRIANMLGISDGIEAEIAAVPNSVGKVNRKKLKEAILPSFIASAD